MGPILTLLLLAAGAWMIYNARKKNKKNYIIPADVAGLLEEHVLFYKELDDDGKVQFERRVKDFLTDVAVRGVGTKVDDIDRVLVGAGAIIPIFAFPDWKYNNINEVLLYPRTFTKEFRTKGNGRNVLGLVGNGVMNRAMILSRPSLRTSFLKATDGHNTVIHEFVHLLDKADGEVDGIPEYLLDKPHMMPWINKMHETIREMKRKKKTDIDMYGATNDAEFLAVISEYFFERPGQLKEKHPELYELLAEMFQPKRKRA